MLVSRCRGGEEFDPGVRPDALNGTAMASISFNASLTTRHCAMKAWRLASAPAFQPRIGFAWRPRGDDKMVLRGGWGRFIDSDNSTRKSQKGEMNAEPKPIGSSPTLVDQRQVFG